MKGGTGKAVAAAEITSLGVGRPTGGGRWVPCMEQSGYSPVVTPVRWATSKAGTLVESYAVDSGPHGWHLYLWRWCRGSQKRPICTGLLGEMQESPQLCVRGCGREWGQGRQGGLEERMLEASDPPGAEWQQGWLRTCLSPGHFTTSFSSQSFLPAPPGSAISVHVAGVPGRASGTVSSG